jgi:hypothetical protein
MKVTDQLRLNKEKAESAYLISAERWAGNSERKVERPQMALALSST